MAEKLNIFWFRRDLRLDDNKGLFEALKAGLPVLPLFIFDTDILDQLDDKADKRVSFIYLALQKLSDEIGKKGGALLVKTGKPASVFTALEKEYDIHSVYCNEDYEPYARARDSQVSTLLGKDNNTFHTFKDQVIFARDEVVKDDGSFYTVFTPYSRKWKKQLADEGLTAFNSSGLLKNLLKLKPLKVPELASFGFIFNDPLVSPGPDWKVIDQYHETRNIPGMQGTSRAGIHLRFGTVSVRKMVSEAKERNEIFLNELIWREFFMQMLWHQPRLQNECFRTRFEQIRWRNKQDEFERWCSGETGYPIVDAGMRQLNETGFMHNRVRMIVASFLVKHLLIDWKWGEAYFASKLLDYEQSSNIGNWQWAAGCGCDAAPYFRVFSPDAQTKKFDPKHEYIMKWVPEAGLPGYPLPMVDHAFARERCLRVFKQALAE